MAVWESDSTDAHMRNNQGKLNCTSIFGRGFVIASLNVSSLLSHIDELRVFMFVSKIDILLMNDTKLDLRIKKS